MFKLRSRLIAILILVGLALAPTADALQEVCGQAMVSVSADVGTVDDVHTYTLSDTYEPAICEMPDDSRSVTLGNRGGRFTVPTGPRGAAARPPRNGQKNDPVTPDGEFLQSETDLSFPGEGLRYEFTRSYRSRVQSFGDLGYSWEHNYDQTLTTDCHNNVFYADGHLGTVEFHTDPGYLSLWHYLPDYRNKLSLEIQPAPANTATITDWATGNVSTFVPINNIVGAGWRLASITSPAGFSINVAWSPVQGNAVLNHVTSVTDTTGRVVHYNYFAPASSNRVLKKAAQRIDTEAVSG